jgi:hypothetical protein
LFAGDRVECLLVGRFFHGPGPLRAGWALSVGSQKIMVKNDFNLYILDQKLTALRTFHTDLGLKLQMHFKLQSEDRCPVV